MKLSVLIARNGVTRSFTDVRLHSWTSIGTRASVLLSVFPPHVLLLKAGFDTTCLRFHDFDWDRDRHFQQSVCSRECLSDEKSMVIRIYFMSNQRMEVVVKGSYHWFEVIISNGANESRQNKSGLALRMTV